MSNMHLKDTEYLAGEMEVSEVLWDHPDCVYVGGV